MDLIGRGAEAEVYKTSTSANILKIRKTENTLYFVSGN